MTEKEIDCSIYIIIVVVANSMMLTKVIAAIAIELNTKMGHRGSTEIMDTEAGHTPHNSYDDDARNREQQENAERNGRWAYVLISIGALIFFYLCHTRSRNILPKAIFIKIICSGSNSSNF